MAIEEAYQRDKYGHTLDRDTVEAAWDRKVPGRPYSDEDDHVDRVLMMLIEDADMDAVGAALDLHNFCEGKRRSERRRLPDGWNLDRLVATALEIRERLMPMRDEYKRQEMWREMAAKPISIHAATHEVWDTRLIGLSWLAIRGHIRRWRKPLDEDYFERSLQEVWEQIADLQPEQSLIMEDVDPERVDEMIERLEESFEDVYVGTCLKVIKRSLYPRMYR